MSEVKMIAKKIGRPVLLSAFVVGSMLAVGVAGGVVAQEQTPTPATIVTHPAHIHMGSCEELDPNPQVPLNDVGPQLNDDDELPAAEDIKGSLTAAPVEVSETEDLEINFDDLFTEAHAINVHESAQNIDNYIACGDIGGPVIDDKVVIGLHQQNDSGYAGIAIVEKDGDDNSKVTVYLSPGLVTGAPAPQGTPTS
jgi:hypothetical protein